jgi:hypothetical protein
MVVTGNRKQHHPFSDLSSDVLIISNKHHTVLGWVVLALVYEFVEDAPDAFLVCPRHHARVVHLHPPHSESFKDGCARMVAVAGVEIANELEESLRVGRN